MSTSHTKEAAFEVLKATLPPILPWSQIHKLLPGIIAPKTLFNAASQGWSAPESFLIGKKRCSSREAFVEWLANR